MCSRIFQLGREYLGWLSAGLESEFVWASIYFKIGKTSATVLPQWNEHVPRTLRTVGLCWPLGEGWDGVTLVLTSSGVSQLCFSLGLCGQMIGGVYVSVDRDASLMKTLNIECTPAVLVREWHWVLLILQHRWGNWGTELLSYLSKSQNQWQRQPRLLVSKVALLSLAFLSLHKETPVPWYFLPILFVTFDFTSLK